MNKFMKNNFTVLILSIMIILPVVSGFGFNKLNNDKKDSPVLRLNSSNAASKKSKVFTGGDIGVTFGNFNEVRLSPLIGYRFTDKVSAGVKFVYRHSWEKITPQLGAEYNLTSDAVGGNIFMQYNPVPEFYVKTEYSYQTYKQSTTQSTSESTAVPFLFIGGGYSKMISKNLYFNAGIKVDILNNLNSPFDNYTPFFDVGMTVGL